MKTNLRKKMTWSFLVSFVLFSWMGSAQYTVDFEDGTKSSYASGTATLSGIQWDMTEALIGSDAGDYKVGSKSARMRGYGSSSMTMLESKSDGLGAITFNYRRYGTDAQVNWVVEYSIDAGSSWTQAGSGFTAPASNDVQAFSATVNVTGDVRIRIKRGTESGSSNKRLNIDSLVLTDFLGAGLPSISTSVASLPTFGDVNVSSNSTSQFFTVSANDLDEDVAVLASSDFEVSPDDIAFSSGFNLSQTGGNLDGEPVIIYVRFSPASSGNKSGVITLSSSGATNATVDVSGTAVIPTPEIFVSTNSLADFGTVLVGGNSASTSFTVSGDLLSDVVSVAASTDFQVSLDDVSFSSGFNLSQTGGNLEGEPVTIYARFSPTSFGMKTGNITLTSTGAASQLIGVSGTGSTPVIEAPNAIAASDITTNSFTANWEAVSGATNYRLDVSTSPDFEVVNAATDLIISEYIEGSATNKLIEIYNGTGVSVDLSDYELHLYSNGSTSPIVLALSGVLVNGETKVYKNSAQTIYLGSATSANTVINFNGDDAVALYNTMTSQFADVFGEIGVDPGSYWNVSGNRTSDRTLVRNSNVSQGAASATGFPTLGTEWTQFNQDTVSNLGSHDFDAIVPSYVAGYQDLTVAGIAQSVSGLAEGVTYYYRVRAFDGTTSINSNVISVTTLISPPTFGSIVQNEVLCQGSEVTFTIAGLVAGSTSTISYTIDGGATQSFTGVVADGLGNAIVALSLSAGNNNQELVITEVERTDVSSTILNPVSGNSINLQVVVATLFYYDFDGDNYGDDNDFVLSCEAPFGYVALNGDCDDNNPAINPGATEICYDGIDQNCDGSMTDGCPVITATLRAENCGELLTSLNQVVRGNSYSQSIPNGVTVTGYRFRVTNLLTNAVRIVDRSNYVFQLTYTDFAEYDTPYSVEVALRLNQEWMEVYGAPCTIVTPGVPNTVLASTSCGATLVQMNNIIRAEVVPSALNYEYNVALIEGGFPVATTTLVRSGASFNLLQLTGIPIKFAAEYSVTIRVQVPTSSGPQWSTVAGAACSVFTPFAPEASIEGCGGESGITPANLNTVVYASPVGGATQYRFTLTDGLAYNQVYTTPSRFFRLSNFNALSPLTAGGTYSVTVEVAIYGNYYAGKDCNILVPGGVGRPITPITRTTVGTDMLMGEFKAVAYPNPFNNSFALDLKTNNTTPVSLAIYDMTGRLLETREIKVDGLSSQTIGERYPSGIYNVLVNQGENTQAIRVIKQ